MDRSEEEARSQIIQDFQTIQRRGFGEVWYTKDSGEMLGIFVNAKRALLLYLQEEGDTGVHSYDAAYSGPEDVTLEFLLENGQRDEYPLVYTITLEEAQRAGEYFLVTGKPAPWIVWLP